MSLTLVRDGKRLTLTATLGRLDEPAERAAAETPAKLSLGLSEGSSPLLMLVKRDQGSLYVAAPVA